MSSDGSDGSGQTRRRVVRGGLALGIALLGAGLIRPFGLLDNEQPGAGATPLSGERSLDLSASSIVDPPTATPTPRRGSEPGSRPGSALDDGETPIPPDDEDDGSTTPEPDDEDDDGPVLVGDTETDSTPTPEPASSAPTAVLAAISPVSFVDVVPGTSGRVTTTATLTGAPADLWVTAAGTDDGENGLAEPEAAAGDDGVAGELAAALRVRLVVDGETLYEGSLAGLDVPGALVTGCVAGDVPLRLEWTLPETTTNEVQTDAARVVVTLAATDCGAPNPFVR